MEASRRNRLARKTVVISSEWRRAFSSFLSSYDPDDADYPVLSAPPENR